MKKEIKFRLEYNEKQQLFHHNYTRIENTNDWFTVYEECTDIHFEIFESYVNRIPKTKLTKDYLVNSVTELQGFLDNLSQYKLSGSLINFL